MEGYFDDPERTGVDRIADPPAPGEKEGKVWMYSGDEAEMDSDGYISITGRIKDLIIRGGENIHPLGVENCLFQHPLIQEVSVVGVPDEKLGEAVAAFIVPCRGVCTEDGVGGKDLLGTTSGAKDILTRKSVREWVAGNLSSHLAPKYVFWTDEYPKTASGKIQKFKLRDMAKDMLAAGSSS